MQEIIIFKIKEDIYYIPKNAVILIIILSIIMLILLGIIIIT